MSTTKKPQITVQTTVNAPLEKAWEYWTNPDHITKWNFAADSWCCPRAINDLKPGGQLSWRMEAVDGSAGFDFNGTYDEVVPQHRLAYTIEDGRRVDIRFDSKGNQTHITETFEAEDVNSLELQEGGWQAILDNYKKHVETS